MPIHIGKEIREVAENKKLSQRDLAKLIKDIQQNVGNDYKKESLSIDRLLLYSAALETNFISFYYDTEPFKFYRKEEADHWQKIIDDLKEKIKTGEEILKAKEEVIENQREAINSLKPLLEAREKEIDYLKEKNSRKTKK